MQLPESNKLLPLILGLIAVVFFAVYLIYMLNDGKNDSTNNHLKTPFIADDLQAQFKATSDVCSVDYSFIKEKDIVKWVKIPVPYMVQFQQYNFAYCFIPKNMIKVMESLLCSMVDPKREPKVHLATDQKCLRQYLVDCFECLRHIPITRLMTIRDPVERLISSWMDKCILVNMACNGCDKNISCFIHKIYDQFRNITTAGLQKYFHSQDYFYPQAWQCAFDHIGMAYTKVIHYGRNEAYKENLLAAFSEQNVSENILKKMETILDQGSGDLTHQKSDTLAIIKKVVYSDRELLQMIVKIYYIDYKLFHLPFPRLSC